MEREKEKQLNLVVQQILDEGEHEIEFLEQMPSTQLHTYFSRFSRIIKEKGVSEEELFEKLFYKKSNLENDFREPIVDPMRAYKESKYVTKGNGINYIG